MKVFFLATSLILCGFASIAQVKKTNNSTSSSIGFSIKGKINGIGNSELYLAHYFGSTQQVIKDTAQADAQGNFVFQGKDELPKGLYLISFSKNRYLDVIIGNTNFSFETDTLDPINHMKFQNSAENEAFFGFQREMGKRYVELRKLEMEKKDQVQIASIRKEIIQYQQSWFEKNKLLFVSKLVRATFEPEIPPFKKKVSTPKDSTEFYQYQFSYYKKHFFDNLDLNDERFIRTPFLQKKLEKYFEDLVVQQPDSIIKDTDLLMSKIKNKEVRRYVIYKIASTYETSNIVGTDAAFAHMGEKYYVGEASLWDTTTVRQMRDRIKVLKPLLIGKRIPELLLTDPSGKRLTTASIPGEYTLVYFYDPECSHCKEETPKLMAQANYFKSKKISVLATSIARNKKQWTDFIKEYKMESIYNGIDIHPSAKSGKEEYYTDFLRTFDIYSTPIIYILDKNKRIIGKKIPTDKIQDFISFYENRQKELGIK
ncbi:TlpA family protein disulfide reductase [Aquirufa aurantiipilula]|uniref:TlpA family protein disulfide reductase n=1 Tax=Aquirufa aurantiipilula TaxID=2696561 RepID=UPI001CAA4FD9|nr:TlpA family protein disulfide reductase [Aquirufa aurantiipilula]MBZ1325361.1 DUF4369 domain-containing protein [Aquirufa aurantiipilula]